MPNEPPQSSEASTRETVERFIEERLKPKLEEIDKKLAKEGDPKKRADLETKRQRLLRDFQREAWLVDAAKRAAQLSYVTHAPKYTNPAAQGSSVFCRGESAAGALALACTDCLGEDLPGDVVGNAAALDVYKFLQTSHDGRTLLSRVLQGDPELAAALSDDPETAQGLMESFAGIVGGDKAPASHTLARQVYFPLPDGGYHLLAPLYPSSLVQAAHDRLARARFSEEAKQARQAEKDQKPHPAGYRDFPDLAAQTFGGSKPQNISQLNTQRHGESWLLPSLPPNWQSRAARPPLGVESVFPKRFGELLGVRHLVEELAGFLGADPQKNLKTRETRDGLVAAILDEMEWFAARLANLEPGWSLHHACRLDRAEALWLDPGRGVADQTFAQDRALGEWREQVGDAFAKWLNYRLRELNQEAREEPAVRLNLGDPEHLEWKTRAVERLKSRGKEPAHA